MEPFARAALHAYFHLNQLTARLSYKDDLRNSVSSLSRSDFCQTTASRMAEPA